MSESEREHAANGNGNGLSNGKSASASKESAANAAQVEAMKAKNLALIAKMDHGGDDDDDDDDWGCQICGDVHDDYSAWRLMLPCGHFSTCAACAMVNRKIKQNYNCMQCNVESKTACLFRHKDDKLEKVVRTDYEMTWNHFKIIDYGEDSAEAPFATNSSVRYMSSLGVFVEVRDHSDMA